MQKGYLLLGIGLIDSHCLGDRSPVLTGRDYSVEGRMERQVDFFTLDDRSPVLTGRDGKAETG
jgi:hypothetical protein